MPYKAHESMNVIRILGYFWYEAEKHDIEPGTASQKRRPIGSKRIIEPEIFANVANA